MVSVDEARRIRFWGCTRKRRYRNRQEASGDSTVKRGATRPYRCCWCKGFHVGNTPKMKDLRRIAQAIRVLAQTKEPA